LRPVRTSSTVAGPSRSRTEITNVLRVEIITGIDQGLRQ
jgi:hypothetical protein